MPEHPSWGPATPSRWTPPLSDNFTSDADWFLPIARYALHQADPEFLDLERWQIGLLRHALETYPVGHPRAGQLRFRQVVISLGRQNGKSVLGMLFALYALLRDPAKGLVIGIASSAEQARIVYARTLQLIAANPALARRFAKLTDTRGIKTNQGALFEIKAAKGSALQGLAITVGVVDELHLLAAELWNALVSGTGGRPNALVTGITTAGDDNSELLIQLYQNGARALAGEDDLERFGFFVWEAPEARVPEDRDELIAYLKSANPSLAEGRMDLDAKLSDIATLPPVEVIRYHLNRFVQAVTAFMPLDLWAKCQRPVEEDFPTGSGVRLVFAFDVDPSWSYGTVSVSAKVGETTYTELVASIPKPTLSQLLQVAIDLAKHSPALFVVDGYQLKQLGAELKRQGYPVMVTSQADVVNASSLFYAKVVQRRIKHGGDPLLSAQLPNTARKNVGASFRIIGKDSAQIDAAMATVVGVYAAESAEHQGSPQIFFAA